MDPLLYNFSDTPNPFRPKLTAFEIWNNDHWNVIHLSDEQLEQLKRFCIRLKGKTNENILS